MKIIIKGKKLFVAATGIVLAASISSSAMAGAVTLHEFDGNDNTITHAWDVITAIGQSGVKDSYSGDPARKYSANALTGSWYAFMTSGGIYDVTILVDAQIVGTFSPGITVWASGANPFNGGSTVGWAETSTSGQHTPASFNATGAIGDPGTAWMSNGKGGNLIETLGYAVSGPSHTDPLHPVYPAPTFFCMSLDCPTNTGTGWGENIINGANYVSTSGNFNNSEGLIFSGITGNFAEMTFYGLKPGWYAVFVGGTSSSDTGGLYDLTIFAHPVPEMETWAMMLAGIVFIGWRMKKQQQEIAALPA